MKRDMGLVYTVMSHVEENQVGRAIDLPEVEGYDKKVILAHVRLLAQAGMLLMSIKAVKASLMIEGLTWRGHDWLDNANALRMPKDLPDDWLKGMPTGI